MRNYLIIKIAAIGDVIMAMPMIREIRKREPDAYITWVCGKSVAGLLRPLPVDELIVIDEKKLLRGGKLEKLQEVFLLWKKLKGRAYDVVAIGHADKRYRLLTKPVRAGRIAAFAHQIGEMCPIPGRHHTDEYIRLIYPDMEKTKTIPPIHLDFPLRAKFEDVLHERNRKIVLLPGGAKNLLADDFCRRWPIEHYVELAKLLIKDGWQVILCGADSDRWVEKYFQGVSVVSWIGQTSLQDMIAVFNHVDMVVTHDSGPMHLAGAASCRVIALFGPTNPHEKIPRRAGVQYLWHAAALTCCPCYDGKTYQRCSDNICLKSISPECVYRRVKMNEGVRHNDWADR